jgi:hypothetical protein
MRCAGCVGGGDSGGRNDHQKIFFVSRGGEPRDQNVTAFRAGAKRIPRPSRGALPR